MTFSELQTVLFEVSNLVNERPIGTNTGDPSEGSSLCPNDLILGKSSLRVSVGYRDETVDFKRRWKVVQQVITCNAFWKKGNRDSRHSSFVRNGIQLKGTRKLEISFWYRTKLLFAAIGKIAQVTETEPGPDR